MKLNLQEDEVFIVLKALHWYNDRITNRSEEHRDFMEEENLDFLRDKITNLLKQEVFID